jgi:hypothetical protein
VLADYNVPTYLWQGWESAKIMVARGDVILAGGMLRKPPMLFQR